MLEHYIGIDMGGTKTEAILCDEKFRVVVRNRYPGMNVKGANPNIIASDVKAMAEEFVYRAGFLPYHIKFVVLAAAGAGDAETRQYLKNAFLGYMPDYDVRIISDAEAALAGAFGGKPGIVIITGTGSIVWGKDLSGKVVRAGGLGYLLGDEGSGFDVGKLGLKSALDAYYAGANTKIADEICELWKIADISQALNIVYKEEKPASKIAEIAPVVLQLAEAGDELATKIISQSMSALSLQIETVAGQLKFDSLIPLCLIGGLSNRRDLLEARILKHLPQGKYDFVAYQYEPAIGAVISSL
jgi:N-acetylglucosamine kinase-like BadF-type ATPase